MDFIGCFDTLEVLLNGVTAQNSDRLFENKFKKRYINNICDEIDRFILRFDGYEYEVEIDKDTNDIRISVIFEEFQIENSSDEFYDIVRTSKEMCLSFIDFEHLKISFVFDGIWDEQEVNNEY